MNNIYLVEYIWSVQITEFGVRTRKQLKEPSQRTMYSHGKRYY